MSTGADNASKPFIVFVSGVGGATGKPTLVAISSAFVGISVSVPQDRPPFLADHKRGYRGHGRAAALGQTPSRYLRRRICFMVTPPRSRAGEASSVRPRAGSALDQREAARYWVQPCRAHQRPLAPKYSRPLIARRRMARRPGCDESIGRLSEPAPVAFGAKRKRSCS
jgi:hypothetical protein